jgi:hypothetical protein
MSSCFCPQQAMIVFTALALFGACDAEAATGTSTVGQLVTFTVTADGTTPFTYQWTRGSVNIAGATAASYVISSAQLADAATYAVVVSNPAGAATSDNAILTVIPVASAPTFTTQPASQTISAGSAVTFSAVVTGSPPPTFQWRLNGTNIPGATGISYMIATTALINAGTYALVAVNSAGSATSTSAVLTVTTVPTVTTQPANQVVNLGQNATLTITGSGIPAPSYQWQRSVDGGGTWTSLVNGAAFSGVTTAALVVISTLAGNNNNQFRCLLTNSSGTVTSNSIDLTVIAPPTALQLLIKIH